MKKFETSAVARQAVELLSAVSTGAHTASVKEYVVIRDVHGNGDDGNPADFAGIPRVWKAGMRSSRGNGSQCCGDPAKMEKNCTGFP